MQRRLPPRLLALSPGTARGKPAALALGRFLKGLVQAGLEGCVLREPGLTDIELFELALDLRAALPADAGGWLCVHDRIAIAASVEADAAHLGFRSLTLEAARRAAPAGLALGLSTHVHDDPSSWQAADYIFHGPVFDTPSKRGLLAPTGTEALVAAQRGGVPVLALGGITPQNLEQVLATGVHGVAVLGALAHATHPEEVLGQLVSKLSECGSRVDRS